MKAAAVAALVDPLRSAGVEMLVVSGVVDAWTPQRMAGLLGDRARVRFVWLTTERAAHHERLAARGGRPEDIERSLLEQRRMLRAPFPRTRVDTTRRSVEEVAAAVLAGTDDGPLAADPPLPPPPGDARSGADPVPGRTNTDLADPVPAHTDPGPDPVPPTMPDPTWLPGRIPLPVTVWTGVRAVGTSSVSRSATAEFGRQEGRIAHLDLGQLGFVEPALSREQHLDFIAAIARVQAAAGAVRLLLLGFVDASLAASIRDRAAPHPVEVIGLRATPEVLRQRVRSRADGSNPGRLVGDDLVGLDEDAQARVVADGLAQQERWDAAPFEDRVEQVSDGLPPGFPAPVPRRRRWWRRD